ncbi:MAG: type II toxin-antitoxin system HicB family antitoxin [Candidatus Hydrogenedentota bacterium]
MSIFIDSFNKLKIRTVTILITLIIQCLTPCKGGIISMREVIIYQGENSYWVAECPSLPGCVSQGKNREDAIKNIKEAISCYIHALEQDNLPVPEERFDIMVVAV